MQNNTNKAAEEKAANKDQAIWGVIGVFGTLIIDMLIFYLGWNMIVVKTFDIRKISMLASLGLVTFITFLKSEVLSKEKQSEYVGAKQVIVHWISEGIFAAILAIVGACL